MQNYTAGSGEPYWYEWTVGLLKIVEMLHSDSDIESVMLQYHGPKGWDDVMVLHSNNHREWYQVKHSADGQNFTFGTLVSANDSGDSLLRHLFAAWREMGLSAKTDQCILFTNREAGERVATSSVGIERPPLLKFMEWLNSTLDSVRQVHDCVPPPEFSVAWKEWLHQLRDGTENEKYEFLSAFKVRTNEGDLDVLTSKVLTDLAEVFGQPESKVRPLLHALDNALRNWTRDGKSVTPEVAYDALVLHELRSVDHRAPPPPVPFFPSREPFLQELEQMLIKKDGPSVLFLSADPGSGKTSVFSQLANRRTENAFRGIVGIRYFAFRPITPDSPIIPPDADRFVNANALWFDLLQQLRRGLRGQLRAYSVPVRDELLDWPTAREHVLRLSEMLSSELDRPFVIAIDGIDHAARAEIQDPAGSREFFNSLPTPEELSRRGLRLLIAGQPAENYPQYPDWLRLAAPQVQILSIGTLNEEDIDVLLQSSAPELTPDQRGMCNQVIRDITSGNTLAVVFAAAEAASCSNADILHERLMSRELQSGIMAYYRNIWEHCLRGEDPDIGTTLAGLISLSRERINGMLLASVFPTLHWSSTKWDMLLGRLGPLLVLEEQGYRVRHNDLRVFFQNRLKASPLTQRQAIASGLADHYTNQSSNRRIAHASLLALLRDAGREDEWPRYFTVQWVMEAAALGISYYDIEPECIAAIRCVVKLRDWLLLGDIGCACETLQRWQERCEFGEITEFLESDQTAPTFLRTELFVRPFKEWKARDLRLLAADAEDLLSKNECARAMGLLQRWLSNLTIDQICRHIRDRLDDGPWLHHERPTLGGDAREAFKDLGEVCRKARFPIPLGKIQDGPIAQAAAAFEQGWAKASCESGSYGSFDECFAGYRLRFFQTIIETLVSFSSHRRWQLTRELLESVIEIRDQLEEFKPNFSHQATWWALRSGAAEDCPDWLTPLRNHNEARFPSEGGLVSALGLARARGWTEVATEVSSIADELLKQLTIPASRIDHTCYYALWLRTAATVGRAEGALSRRGSIAASELVRPQEINQLLTALWDTETPIDIHIERGIAGTLASELVDTTSRLSDAHITAALAAAEQPLNNWPIDYRRSSLWMLLRHAGQTQRQRAWIIQWIGEEGWIWKESSNERENILCEWKAYTTEIGELQLFKKVESRLSWLRISYKTDRDDSFFAATLLLDELLRVEPSEWEKSGVRLWSLTDSARATGCDNNNEDYLERILAKAALRQQPNAMSRLVGAKEPNRKEDYWLYSIRNSLITAATELLKEQFPFESKTKILLWCLACGLCRWFQEGDIKLLSELKATLLASASDQTDRDATTEIIRQLTPAEWIRIPKPIEVQHRGTPLKTNQEQQSFDGEISRLGKAPLALNTCLWLIRETLRSGHPESETLIPRILLGVGAAREYASSWRWGDVTSLSSALEIGSLLSDDQLWPLAEAACREAGQGSHWLQGVTDNINVTFITRARGRGVSAIKDGLNRHLRMHEQWLEGGPNELPISDVILDVDLTASNWSEAVADVLLFLLHSRSGEVVASALHGIHALVGYQPPIIKYLFLRIDDDRWRARWILKSAELWAALQPDDVDEARPLVERWLESDSLEHRLQAWIVLARLAYDRDEPAPLLPWPEATSDQPHIVRRGREILETTAETYGLMRISSRHNAARAHLHQLEAITGELTAVRNRVAELLDNLPPRLFPRHEWPHTIRQHNDFDIGLDDIEEILGQALDETMPRPQLGVEPLLAQGFLSNEDPWIVRHTPPPDTDLSAWPTEKEIGEWQTPPDLKSLQEKLLMLSCHHKIDADEQVLAARVEIYSRFFDVHYHVWWEQNETDQTEVRASHIPTTISARSFCWWIGDWWEPQITDGEYPIAFLSGGSQRLAHSFVNWFPSTLWLDLGWRPQPQNPLLWTFNDKPIARYEYLHGPLRETRSYHHRQQLLSRWVIKRVGFEMMEAELGGMRRLDDITSSASPER